MPHNVSHQIAGMPLLKRMPRSSSNYQMEKASRSISRAPGCAHVMQRQPRSWMPEFRAGCRFDQRVLWLVLSGPFCSAFALGRILEL